MKRRKMAAVIMAAVMTAMTLAGCGSGGEDIKESQANQSAEQRKEESQPEESTEDQNQTGGSSFNETGYPIVNEPLTLNVLLAVRDVDTLMEPNDMPCIQKLEEQTGIHLEWEIVRGTDWGTELNLMFASGEYPDIILNGTVDTEEYGVTQNILIPLDELEKQYMPIYTERIADEVAAGNLNPTISLIASDGKQYCVGQISEEGFVTEQHFYINQDWLDALELEMPSTIDELTDVLRAFKTGDPNGNGTQDEVPLEVSLGGDQSVLWYTSFFGVPLTGWSNRYFYIDDNKKVQFGPTQDGYRRFLEWMHLLYTEELLDPEVLSQDTNTVAAKIKEGNVGMFNGWRLQGMNYSGLVENSHTLYVPGVTDGVTPVLTRTLAVCNKNNGAFITSTNEHVPESLRLLDAMLETENMFTLFYGLEGTGWEYNAENGKVDSLPQDDSAVLDRLGSNRLIFMPPKYSQKTKNPSIVTTEKLGYGRAYDDAGIIQKYQSNLFNLIPFTAEESNEISMATVDLQSYVAENLSRFIQEGVTDDSWNAYVSEFSSLKVESLQQLYQEGVNQLNLD